MFPFSKPCGDLPWGARDSPAHGTVSVFEQELRQRTPGRLQVRGCCRGSRLEEGRGLQVAMGTRASGLFLHTWLACFTSREPVGWGQDATSSAPTCREVTSGLALGHPPLGSRALASPKHVGSWLQGGSFVTTWVSNHIKGCGERLAAFGHGQTWDRGCGCPQPHPSLSSGTFPTSPSAQLGRDLSQ